MNFKRLMNRIFFILFWILSPCISQAQLPGMTRSEHHRADSLRGQLTALRTCYDINYYHLDILVDIPQRSISGKNLFQFTAQTDINKLQFDLFDNLSVDSILYRGTKLHFEREYHAVFVDFPTAIPQGSQDSMTVYYSGMPLQANRAPWDGGFDWKTDSQGKPWVATACQGLGASSWWPNKDHQSDEVDSMLVSVTVPADLMNVSNGRLRSVENVKAGFKKYNWFIANPINNYNIALNIGDYIQFSDSYLGEQGPLDIEYYVLRESKDRFQPHLEKNTKEMLQAFEHWFGPYPFYKDGFKLIETSHLGMEHQSGIAYGNKFLNGYLGRDGSGTGWGLKWDFIIIHEAGHEWFGNNITSKDMADMWIHESFTNYSESLFIEYYYGKEAAQAYLFGNRRSILNDKPLYGIPNVNKSGSGDMYNKGGVLQNMVRTCINNDEKWRDILRGLNKKFYHQTVDYMDIISYINQESGMDLSRVYEQYVKHRSLPILELKVEQDGDIYIRWNAEVAAFDMPIRIKNAAGEYIFIHPTDKYKKFDLPGITAQNFEYDLMNYYIGLSIQDFSIFKK